MRSIFGMMPLGLLTLCVGCQKSAEPTSLTEAQRLADMLVVKSHRGQDMLSSRHDERYAPLQAALGRLCPRPQSPHGPIEPRPANVWDFGQVNGAPSYLVLEAYQLFPDPGTTPVWLTLLAESGDTLTQAHFDTGHRCYLWKAALSTFDGFEFPLVAFEIDGGIPGHTRQLYALVGGRFDLVRVEEEGGVPARCRYYVKSFSCGPEPPEQTDDEWEADLFSSDRARVLRALTWLGGQHLQIALDSQHESWEQIELVRRVRQRPTVRTRLKQLAAVGPEWERGMAELALDAVKKG